MKINKSCLKPFCDENIDIQFCKEFFVFCIQFCIYHLESSTEVKDKEQSHFVLSTRLRPPIIKLLVRPHLK